MSVANNPKINQVIALCRPGFENDCAHELMSFASQKSYNAYVKAKPNSGYIQLMITAVAENNSSAMAFIESVDFQQLIFVRQWFASPSEITVLPEQDRITAISDCVNNLGLRFDAMELSYPDTNTGKSLSKFCKQFMPHLQRTLKSNAAKTGNKLNIFFLDSTHAFIGVNHHDNSAISAMGIPRLRMPSSAPSRSTLKLDEAIAVFLTSAQRDELIKPGMRAVDLGAAPGGWTWQLVQRQLFVTAIDNGAMDKALMQTGMVEHLKTDAFSYSQKKVDWLVCDMVEQPHRVSKLMAHWFTRQWCHQAIFNLKLPMNKRYETVMECEKILKAALDKIPRDYTLQIRQLYHDREEVTVCILMRHNDHKK